MRSSEGVRFWVCFAVRELRSLEFGRSKFGACGLRAVALGLGCLGARSWGRESGGGNPGAGIRGRDSGGGNPGAGIRGRRCLPLRGKVRAALLKKSITFSLCTPLLHPPHIFPKPSHMGGRQARASILTPLHLPKPPSASTTASSKPKRSTPTPCSWGGCASARRRRRWPPALPAPCSWACRRLPPPPFHLERNKAPKPPARGAWARRIRSNGAGRRHCRLIRTRRAAAR